MPFFKRTIHDLTGRNKKTEKLIGIIMVILLFISMLLLAKEAADISSASLEIDRNNKGKTVVLDAGHGAADSGKIGINDAMEKDINLQIAQRVKKLLEAQDI